MTASPALELDSFFMRELQTVNEDVRRVAALATFHRLRPGNDITVEEFLTSLQAHEELWAVVRSLGIVEFAPALAGGGGGRSGPAPRNISVWFAFDVTSTAGSRVIAVRPRNRAGSQKRSCSDRAK